MSAVDSVQTNFSGLNDPLRAMGKEYLLTGKGGSYVASTIGNCNTRKYHGLFVVPQPRIDGDGHVLLSALDEAISDESGTWELAMHCYPGVYYPEGYRYILEFTGPPVPQWIYQAGSLRLKKELLLNFEDDQLLIKYTLINASGPATLQLMPLLSFRNMHTLSKANAYIKEEVTPIKQGIKMQLYSTYMPLYMQLSADAVFVPAPDWHFNVEYPLEAERGYEFREDLYRPGYFEISLCPGQSVIFSAGLKEASVIKVPAFDQLLAEKKVPTSLEDYLMNAARQFIVNTNGDLAIKAGYYWFGRWGRDTCIALPGLMLLTGDSQGFKSVLNGLLRELKDGLLPNTIAEGYSSYNTADASLWCIWALQQYVQRYGNALQVWKEYGPQLKSILHHYKNGTRFGIKMEEDGLIYAGEDGYALTWMDAVAANGPVTPRAGKAVDINALWYNAVCFCLQLAKLAKEVDFINTWGLPPEKIADAFRCCFWDAEKQYLVDYVNGNYKDKAMRPNQLLAVSLPYTPLMPEMQKAVIDKVREQLLTPRGLRTLSPEDSRYCGHYCGDQEARDHAYHQGTVWPWLLGHFTEGYLNVYGYKALPLLEELYAGMVKALDEYCLYSLAEVYDGDPPHKAGGAVAQAWSVAELLRMNDLIKQYQHKAILLPNDMIVKA
ncbi:amylo-alpha-1,6-glucosidase [Chitinophaga sp. Ak27]|uniref:amylo-alpha-1,6-glucosidase n=1 Tax=Chitinophaga sp. Ak27 TaxID=2726116 RepID=UPI00145C62A5|nr:amylo-alpha-1,6-glucosidase [Chitinophaga sp. Ak27]NLU91470.1 amylo-alpha-1,6-glucosidase [Chitinophaga sp. Ak27]